MKKILIIIISVFCSIIVYSQTDSIKVERKHSLGLSFGITTGVGISYRYMPGKYGIQISYLPIIDKSSEYQQKKFQFSGAASLAFLKKIKSTRRIDFNLYEAQTYIMDNENGLLTLGAGSHTDILLGSDMSLSINIGLAYLTNIGNSNIMDNDWQLLPDFGFGFYYKF